MIYVEFQKHTDIKKHILTGNGLLRYKGDADRAKLLTDIGRRIVEDIDKGVVLSKDNIGLPKYDTSIPPSDLAGGTQALIYLLSNPERPIRLECFGENCFKYIWEIADIVDYDINFISTGYGGRIFEYTDAKRFIVCKNDMTKLYDEDEFDDKRKEIIKYDWED